MVDPFLVPASAPRLVQQWPWYVLSCLWGDAYKRTLVANARLKLYLVLVINGD